MNGGGYLFSKIWIALCKKLLPKKKSKIIEKKVLTNFFRKRGIKVGEDCVILSNIVSSEPYLITIGNRVTISNGVQILTHDNSIDRVLPDVSDIFGKVSIGDDCFIGAHCIIMPGVTIGNKVIIGAGSVVSKSFKEEGIIIAGNPARKVGDWDAFAEKYKNIAFDIKGDKRACIEANPDKIVQNR